VLWDLLPTGPQMGGAPANFACHARALGIHARIVTRVGRDDFGDAIKRRLAEMEVAVELIQTDDTLPTGTVTVTLTADGIPAYTIHDGVAWDQLAAEPDALAAVATADAVCFGTLAQRSVTTRRSIQRLLAGAPASSWRILDINLRQNYYDVVGIEASLRLANVLKLTAYELSVLAPLSGTARSVRQQIETLAERFGLRVVVLTRGEGGSLLWQDGRWSDRSADRIDVKDTVGAGDAFTAALCVGLLRGLDLDEINTIANEVAAFVCVSAGATPPLPEALRRRLAVGTRAARC
jgi:fructokinase